MSSCSPATLFLLIAGILNDGSLNGIIDGSLNVRNLVLERFVDVLGLVDVSLSIPLLANLMSSVAACLGIPKFWTLEVPGARMDLT